MQSKSHEQSLALDNGRVRATFEVEGGGVREAYYALADGGPRLVATNVSHEGLGACFLAAEPDDGTGKQVAPGYEDITRASKKDFLPTGLPQWPAPGPAAPACPIKVAGQRIEGESGATQTVVLTGTTEAGERFERRIALAPGEDVFHVTVSMISDRNLSLEYLQDRFCFAPEGAPDFTWTQELKTGKDDLFPDWTFKCPAAILQNQDLMLALIPDVEALSTDTLNKCHVALDMDARTTPGPTVSYGLVPSIPHGHSLFKHIPGQRVILDAGAVTFSHYLLVQQGVPRRQAHRPVAHFVWKRFGHRALTAGHAAQKFTFRTWERKTWQEFAQEVWMDVERNGVACGGLRNKCEALCPVNDAWFCAWWNNMRSAYAMALYARRAGDAVAHDRAEKVLNLALDAPRNNGCFPVLFFIQDDGTHTWNNDHRFGGYLECYHAFDMCWTSYWLLRWHNEFDPKNDRILPNCVALGDFLLGQQRDSGFIPSYYNENFTLRDGTRLNEESAEPAACAVFLVELYKSVGDQKYLDAAVKAIEYVQNHIVPEAKWFDYETFLSCSPKPYDFYDPITTQHPQNNMGTIQAAMGFLAVYDATRDTRFLEWGMNVLDYLSLTQQVWSHPAMTPNLIGGFTTQNTDAEWSDARQAYCAVVYLDYFDRTGNREYLERGVAALRSGFVVAPYENWAHIGYADWVGALSGFNWGQGSAMASVEMVWDRYGDVLVDVEGQWACGINGCTVNALHIDGNTISLVITTVLA